MRRISLLLFVLLLLLLLLLLRAFERIADSSIVAEEYMRACMRTCLHAPPCIHANAWMPDCARQRGRQKGYRRTFCCFACFVLWTNAEIYSFSLPAGVNLGSQSEMDSRLQICSTAVLSAMQEVSSSPLSCCLQQQQQLAPAAITPTTTSTVEA